MNERPRLAVKDPLLVSFVVVRRVSADRKECFQRQHFHLTQQVKVTEFWCADEYVTARELQRFVKFGESFIEPERRVRNVVFDVQVNIFVKRSRGRITARIERECDVVDVVAGQEEARDVRRPSLIDWFEYAE